MALPRESKYRHIFHDIANTDMCYNDLRPDCFGESQHIAINTRYWAVPIIAGGGGSFMVHELSKTGRIDRNHPLFKVHTARILELEFNKFQEQVISTSSDDCTIRISKIPEEIIEDVTKEEICLTGHGKKVTSLAWHPTAENVLASASADKTVIIWDAEVGEDAICISDHSDLVYSTVWNENGQFIGTSCQDRFVRIIDPRDESGNVLSTTGHENKKNSKIFWVNNRNLIGSIGFNKESFREILFFDTRKMQSPYHRTKLDRQNSKFFPHFEEGNDILFLAGKGDTGVRSFELSDQDGFCHPISELKALDPHKGVAVFPRRCLDTAKCEIFKILRLKSNNVEPFSIMVPRRNAAMVFQEDLYPDCFAGKPSMTIDEYFDGENRPPILESMNKKASDSAGGGRFRRGARGRKQADEVKEKPAKEHEKVVTPVKKAGGRQSLLDKRRAKRNKPMETSVAPTPKQSTPIEEKPKESFSVASSNNEEVEADLKIKLKEVESLTKKVSDLEKQRDKLKEENTELGQKNDTMKTQNRNLETEIKELKSQITTLEQENNEPASGDRTQLHNMKKKYKKAVHKVKKLEKELERTEDIVNKQAATIKEMNKKLLSE